MKLTDVELIEVANLVSEYLTTHSKGISEVKTAASLDGIKSMPVWREIGGIPEIVNVDITLLAQPSWDAVKELVVRLEAAIGTADDATRAATEATTETLDATKLTRAATKNADDATELTKAATSNANSEADRAKQQADNPQIIGENDNWWKWDEALGEYVDTGKFARGTVAFPTPRINTEDMCLYLDYPDVEHKDVFTLVDGCLMFNIK